jgi:aquaporin rerated protein, invertebrate
VAQIIGGYLGYGLLRAVIPSDKFDGNGFCVSLPGQGVSQTHGLVIEFLITSILIMICGGVWDPRNAKHHGEKIKIVSVKSY